jgi:hypothetical protein
VRIRSCGSDQREAHYGGYRQPSQAPRSRYPRQHNAPLVLTNRQHTHFILESSDSCLSNFLGITPDDLIDSGWQRVERALLSARSEDHLIVHWFLTPDDADTHTDAHWHDNARIEKFVRVVVPTLADQLRASMLTVAVPWNVTDERATLTLVAVITGEPAAIAARSVTRSALADAAPYWKLGTEAVDPPAPLVEIVLNLTI